MTEPVIAPTSLADLFDICLGSVLTGAAIVPEDSRPEFAEPHLELCTWVATEAGDALVIHRPTVEAVTGCELWGGNLSDDTAPFTILWRDRGKEVVAWLDAAAGRPDAIDLRRNPDYEAVFICDDPDKAPIALGVASFRFEDEMAEEAPRFPPDGAIIASIQRWSGLTCAELRGTP